MASFSVLSGTKYEVKAANAEEAEAKMAAWHNGEDCPCGFPQWAEQAAAEGQELCECVEEIEADTWIEEN